MPARESLGCLVFILLVSLPAARVVSETLRKGLDLSFSGKPHVEKPIEVAMPRIPPRLPGERIRLATYNIQHLTDGVDDWIPKTPEQTRRQAIHAAALISEFDPDILLIQEIENARTVERLNVAMKQPYPIACITDFGSDTEREVSQNIALLSRLPLKGLRELDFEGLTGAGRPPRGVLSFFVELDQGRRLLVYGVHLKSNVGQRPENYSKRWNALRIVRADYENLCREYDQHVWEAVIVGDMNVDPSSDDFGDDPTFQPLTDWVDLWLGRPIEERTTIPTRHGDPGKLYPPQGFDRFIFSGELSREPWVGAIPRIVAKGVDTANVHAVPGERPEHVSDHYPVYVDIARTRAASGDLRRPARGLLEQGGDADGSSGNP